MAFRASSTTGTGPRKHEPFLSGTGKGCGHRSRLSLFRLRPRAPCRPGHTDNPHPACSGPALPKIFNPGPLGIPLIPNSSSLQIWSPGVPTSRVSRPTPAPLPRPGEAHLRAQLVQLLHVAAHGLGHRVLRAVQAAHGARSPAARQQRSLPPPRPRCTSAAALSPHSQPPLSGQRTRGRRAPGTALSIPQGFPISA